MGSMSPVLQAFFQGSQNQESIVKQASDMSNQAEVRKQRQQELDDVMKRFDASHKLETSRVQNELDRTKLEHDAHMSTARNQFIEMLSNEQIPIHQSMQQTGLAIPGLPQLELPDAQGNMAQRFQSATPDMVLPGGGLPTMQNDPTQSMTTPGGENITVQTPKLHSTLAQAAEQAKADVELKRAQELYRTTKEPQYLAQIDAANQRAVDLNDRHKYESDQRARVAELLGGMKERDKMDALTGGLVGPPLQQHIDEALAASPKGYYDVNKEPNAKIKQMIRTTAAARGIDTDIPQTTYADIYKTANSAVDLKNAVAGLNSVEPAPRKLTDRVMDTITGSVGYKGLGVDKQTYDTFMAKIAPSIEIASGVSPGAMRSVALLNMFKGLVRQPGDSSNTIKLKEAMASEIPLAAVSKQIATMPMENRKEVWSELIRKNPSLMEQSKDLHERLLRAAQSGIFEPGKGLTNYLGRLK